MAETDEVFAIETRKCITKLDDFLYDLEEKLVPSAEFISHANRVMDEIFEKLKVTYHDNFVFHSN